MQLLAANMNQLILIWGERFCRRSAKIWSVSALNLMMAALPLSSTATGYFASLQNISVPWYFHLKQTTQHWQDIFTSTFRNWGRFLAISRHWPFPDCLKLRLIKLVELPKSFTESLTQAWSELYNKNTILTISCSPFSDPEYLSQWNFSWRYDIYFDFSHMNKNVFRSWGD